MVEEAQLLLAPVVRVKVSPVFDPVRFQPLLPGGSPHIALEIAAWMQTLAAPIGGGEQRRDNLVPPGRTRLVILVVQRMGYDFGAKFGTVLGELFIGQGLGPAYQLAVNTAALATLA